MGRTTELRRELERRFHPHAKRLGFSIEEHGALGADFRRLSPERVDVFDLQWHKYGAPRFVVNFGQGPGAGVVHFGEHVPPEKMLSYMGPEMGRLQPGRSGASTRAWFRQDPPWLARLVLRRPDRPAAGVVDSLLALFPEVESWFRSGARGPHLHFASNPFGGARRAP